MKQVENYRDAVEYCLETPKFTKKNKPELTKKFLQFLKTENKKTTIIHVAGTNGKGSVCAYLQAVGMTLGKNTATFTSPHLCDIRERIQINGEMISEQDFLTCFQTVMGQLLYFQRDRESQKHYHPTFFELLFFIAMVYFSKKTPEIIILETGMGGRLDATNVVSGKKISVITEIGYDHMEYLGDTLPQIAGEKAGIIAKGVPVVYWDKKKEISDVIERKAEQMMSPCIKVSEDFITFLGINNKEIAFSYKSRYYGSVVFRLPSQATYQMENATIAAAAAEELWHGEMTLKQLQTGIGNMVHRGRMEEILPGVYLDGAHNVDGIDAFIKTVQFQKENETDGEKKRLLLFSVVRDKQYKEMIKKLLDSQLFNRIAIAPLRSERGLSGEELSNTFGECNYVIQFPSVKEAWESLISRKCDNEDFYVAGSLYLVGQIKGLLANS